MILEKLSGMERFFYVNEFFDRKSFSLRSQTIIAKFLLYNEKGCPDWEAKDENV